MQMPCRIVFVSSFNKSIISFCSFRAIEVIFSLFTDPEAGAAANGKIHKSL